MESTTAITRRSGPTEEVSSDDTKTWIGKSSNALASGCSRMQGRIAAIELQMRDMPRLLDRASGIGRDGAHGMIAIRGAGTVARRRREGGGAWGYEHQA
jgi:hypothetical protein